MDAVTVSLIIGMSALILERGIQYFRLLRSSSCRSKCCCGEVEVDEEFVVPEVPHWENHMI